MGEGGITSSEEAVFGEDCYGVDEEDGDCLRVSSLALLFTGGREI